VAESKNRTTTKKTTKRKTSKKKASKKKSTAKNSTTSSRKTKASGARMARGKGKSSADATGPDTSNTADATTALLEPAGSLDREASFGAGLLDSNTEAAPKQPQKAAAHPKPVIVPEPEVPAAEKPEARGEKSKRRSRRGRGRRGAKTEAPEAESLPQKSYEEAAEDMAEALETADESAGPDVPSVPPAAAKPATRAPEGFAAFLDEPVEAPSGEDKEDDRRGRRRGRRGRRSKRGGQQEAKPRTQVEAGVDEDELPEPLDEDENELAPAGGPKRQMLINVADADECRIALLTEGRLDELHMERAASTSNVGNIYKGVVTNVEPSIQAAFIDFGLPSHGFLHISDLQPSYFPDNKRETEVVGKKTPRRHRPPIQQCLRRGTEMIVQVIKEGIGTKGPTLTTYLSLPGRFLVMMPGMEQLGVSRKIEDDQQRRQMRDALNQLSLPKGVGVIMRTAGLGRPKRDLQRDLNFLVRLWRRVEKRMKQVSGPAELYRESDLVIRTIRDLYDSSIGQIVVDSPGVAKRVREFLAIASPRSQDVVKLYEGSEPLYHRYGIETEIDKLHSKRVPLPCGGSLVIEQTEALVAIDVNSGKFRIPDNAEETALRVNVEAADEIARQLRLRDLGGLIVIDFIDMMQERHRRKIERQISEALKKHKERAKVLRISQFGILELTRQRQRPSFAKSVYRDCPRCAGSGRVKAPETVSLEVMRHIRLASQRPGVARIDVRVATSVAEEILNRKRPQLAAIEQDGNQSLYIHAEPNFTPDQVEWSCTDRRGREILMTDLSAQNEETPPRTQSRRPSRGRSRGRRRSA